MPLFKSHPVQEPEPVVEHPTRKGSIFARNRSISPEPVPPTTHNRGFFSRRRSSDDSSLGHHSSGSDRINRGNSVRSGTASSTRSGGGFFAGRDTFNVHKDPTIVAARGKVTSAEKAEHDADRALLQARAMVREARDHVRILEKEAAEEHKRAKAKQAVANTVSKSASGLGRHGP
ncbi:hypothetical protein DFH09DRAFT_910173 [Mycena vulgaris]|nr:hypothetical protein DFH09DRAFT_910173 [Mycena vulgaris]